MGFPHINGISTTYKPGDSTEWMIMDEVWLVESSQHRRDGRGHASGHYRRPGPVGLIRNVGTLELGLIPPILIGHIYI